VVAADEMQHQVKVVRLRGYDVADGFDHRDRLHLVTGPARVATALARKLVRLLRASGHRGLRPLRFILEQLDLVTAPEQELKPPVRLADVMQPSGKGEVGSQICG
jgi:hypothetical protein